MSLRLLAPATAGIALVSLAACSELLEPEPAADSSVTGAQASHIGGGTPAGKLEASDGAILDAFG